MGCFKSKHKYAVQNANTAEQDRRKCDGAEQTMVEPRAVERREKALLDYAQRLSEDIVNAAVNQWVETESRYRDIPYIESDAP